MLTEDELADESCNSVGHRVIRLILTDTHGRHVQMCSTPSTATVTLRPLLFSQPICHWDKLLVLQASLLFHSANLSSRTDN